MTPDEALARLTGPGSPFEIAEVSVRGQRQRVFTQAPPNLRALFQLSALHGERTALVYEGERWSYAELHARVAALAHALARRFGVGPGDRVAIGMRNTPEWPLVFWASQCLGAIAVPLNAFWTGGELRYALEHSGSRLALLDGERLERLRPLLPQLRGIRWLVARADSSLPPEVERLEDALAAAPAGVSLPQVQIDPDDDSTILYTSGTTGRPKGAVHSHRNHVHNVWNGALGAALAAVSDPAGAAAPGPPQRVALQTFPFFHVAGLGLLQAHGLAGVKIVLMHKWDARRALELIQREGVSWVAGVPTVVRALLETAEREGADLSSLEALGSGGAPVPPDLIRRVGERFRRRVAPLNGYGLTETTSSVVAIGGDAYLDAPDSVGLPNPTAGLRVVGPDGCDVAAGQVGEIWLSGPQVVRGYWNDEEATAEAFQGGWFRSGDLGFLDAAGLLHVVDRIKDMVIRGGENVYCAEVEGVLFEHPAVADVAVIGLPHPGLGEEVAAAIQLRPGTAADVEAIRAFATARLAAYKVPSRVSFRGEPLPRNAVGKVLKRQLREELMGD